MKPGTFSFCEKCPSAGNCCSRVNHGGAIESPAVFQHEIDAIQKIIGTKSDSFSDECTDLKGVYRFKSNGSGCVFYKGGRCAIYSSRPFDCKLFPFDVRWIDEGYKLILYEKLCPIGFDPKDLIDDALRLVKTKREHLEEYEEFKTPGMEGEPFNVICDITNLVLSCS